MGMGLGMEPDMGLGARLGLGTGLGLGIVRRVVEDMNGRITFESVAGKGTTMVIVFPVAGTKLGPAVG